MATTEKTGAVRLTDTRVRRLEATGRLYRVWDSVVSGFHVQVTPAGGKSYRIQFQRKNGEKVCATLGNAEVWSLDSAREKARELREVHDKGGDARAFVNNQREAKTIKALVVLWREDYREKLKPSTRASYDSILHTCILPALGTRQVKDLDYAAVKAMHRKESKDHPTGANRAVEVLSRLLSIAEKEGWRERGTNPCRGLEKVPLKARNRVFSAGELAALEGALTALEKVKKLDPIAADALRFLALSGLRKGEALGLRWKDVDLERNTMRFEDHKTAGGAGVKVLPLNPHLRAILQRRAGARLGPLVFPGMDGQAEIGGLRKMWLRVVEKCSLADTTPHDLRRTFMSVSVELGYPPAIGDALLGHSLGKIRDTYVNLGTDGILATASRETADWIAAAMAGEKVQPGVKVSKEKTAQDGTA